MLTNHHKYVAQYDKIYAYFVTKWLYLYYMKTTTKDEVNITSNSKKVNFTPR